MNRYTVAVVAIVAAALLLCCLGLGCLGLLGSIINPTTTP